MASTSRSEAQARSRSNVPSRPTSSVFPGHKPGPVDNAVNYPKFVRSTLPQMEHSPESNAPLLLIPPKPAQDEDADILEEEEHEEPPPRDDDEGDGERFRTARAARANGEMAAADPREAILRFVEKKKQEAKSGVAEPPIVHAVVIRPARKRRKVADEAKQQQGKVADEVKQQAVSEQQETRKGEARSAEGGGKDGMEGPEYTRKLGSGAIKEPEPGNVTGKAQMEDKSVGEPVPSETNEADPKGVMQHLYTARDRQTEELVVYSSSDDDDEDGVS